jgi:predicted nucleic acid-binding Zn ribbon protein
MSTHTSITPDPEKSERAPCSASVVASPRPCPVCGVPLTGRQQACSAKCRAAKSRQARGDALAVVEEQLTRALARVRVLRGAAKDCA